MVGPGSSKPKQGPGCQVKQDPWSASSADSDHPVARWSFTPSPVRVDHHEVTSPYSGEGLGEDRKGKSREQGHVAEPGAVECWRQHTRAFGQYLVCVASGGAFVIIGKHVLLLQVAPW